MKYLTTLFALAGLLLSGCTSTPKQHAFARVEEGRFVVGDQPYYFVGANFWYGAILGSQGEGGDRERLARELDLLKANGVTNLRILVGADGAEGVFAKVEPTLQVAPGQYNDELLDGLDYLMQQLGARGMMAVLYLNNAWEWSGGYGQYLMWTGAETAPIPALDGYQNYVNYVGRFIPSEEAKALFADHVRNIVSRTNRYTGLKYSDDPAIFSWQICNEPRPFGRDNKEAFAEWIGQTARLIRSLDPNHMISTGSEGYYGCEADEELTERIHAIPEIAYLNLHIWPYNWRWVTAETLMEDMEQAKRRTDEYIDMHLAIAERIRKPAVLEEFGFPRDGFRFERGSSTEARDIYYRHIFDRIVASKEEGGLLVGCNFWSWGGAALPAHVNWERGDDYTGDPAQEQQGLNSVFDDDTTVALIRATNERLQK